MSVFSLYNNTIKLRSSFQNFRVMITLYICISRALGRRHDDVPQTQLYSSSFPPPRATSHPPIIGIGPCPPPSLPHP